MKKILALIVAFITSLNNNTEFSVVDDKSFTSDYYTIASDVPPDYRSYYGAYDGDDVSYGCITTKYDMYGKTCGSGNKYWIVNSESPTDDMVKRPKSATKDEQCTYSDLFLDNCYIICPSQATLTSSSNGGVTTMEIKCKGADKFEYTFTFTNMMCWYCDVSRFKGTKCTLSGHTCDEQKGSLFAGGDVLGKSTKDTKVTITCTAYAEKNKEANKLKPNAKVSLKTFYGL